MTIELSTSLSHDNLVVMRRASDLRFFASTDGDLAYRDSGGPGIPVVLLHAGFVDHTMWDEHIPVLAQEFRVIAPDARGHGRSANASRPFRQADDLAELLHHLDVGPAVLVGVSMGAMIAVEAALEHPDVVRALVVSGGGTDERVLTEPWSKQVYAAQLQALAAGDIEAWHRASDAWAHGPGRPREAVRPEIYTTFARCASEPSASTLPTKPITTSRPGISAPGPAGSPSPSSPSTAHRTYPSSGPWPTPSPARPLEAARP